MDKLKDIYLNEEFLRLNGVKTMDMGVTNIDDAIRYIASKGIKDIEVTTDAMIVICWFFLANIGQNDDENRFQILKEGRVEKFLGVNLHLDYERIGKED